MKESPLPESAAAGPLGAAVTPWPSGRVGYVALLGRPNAGKSTLLNTLLDYRLAAVSPQPQTTRRRWLGIRSTPTAQVLFLDTPGVHISHTALDRSMERHVRTAVEDADLVICLADPTRMQGEEDALTATVAAESRKPVLLVINKEDAATVDQIAEARRFYRERLPEVRGELALTATWPDRCSELFDHLVALLPEGPFFYDPEEITTARERDVAAELVRETALESLREEVPHAIAVTIEEWDEAAQPPLIRAVVHVEREQQKRIVVGRNGSRVTALRKAAERKLCEQFGPVSLRLWVTVSKNWRKRSGLVRQLVG